MRWSTFSKLVVVGINDVPYLQPGIYIFYIPLFMILECFPNASWDFCWFFSLFLKYQVSLFVLLDISHLERRQVDTKPKVNFLHLLGVMSRIFVPSMPTLMSWMKIHVQRQRNILRLISYVTRWLTALHQSKVGQMSSCVHHHGHKLASGDILEPKCHPSDLICALPPINSGKLMKCLNLRQSYCCCWLI